jgi:hypothetical protein
MRTAWIKQSNFSANSTRGLYLSPRCFFILFVARVQREVSDEHRPLWRHRHGWSRRPSGMPWIPRSNASCPWAPPVSQRYAKSTTSS